MLRAAGEAFAAHGFYASSMDEIARAAGISKPMLYRYFGSKEDLYAAYLRMTGHELIDRVRAPQTRDQEPQVRLRAGLRGFLTYVQEHAAGWTVLHGESTAPTHAHIAREITGLRARIITMLTTLFDDEAVAHAFAGAAESLATWWVDQPERSIDHAIDILMTIAQAASGFDQHAREPSNTASSGERAFASAMSRQL